MLSLLLMLHGILVVMHVPDELQQIVRERAEKKSQLEKAAGACRGLHSSTWCG